MAVRRIKRAVGRCRSGAARVGARRPTDAVAPVRQSRRALGRAAAYRGGVSTAPTVPASTASSPTIAQSLREYGSGVLGGLLVSLPLLYTMEIWWAGIVFAPERLLAGLAGTFALLLLYNRYAGLRADSTWREIAVDSVEEFGVALGVSATVLWLVGEIGPGVPWTETLGKVAVEAMAVAVGVSVGTAQFGGGGGDQGMDEDDGADGQRSPLGTHLALALCGAVLVAANVAPTDEIVQIAAEAPTGRLLAIVAASLLLGIATLAIDTSGGEQVGGGRLLWRGVQTYAVALVASAALLWFFGRFEGQDASSAAALVAVLGFPTAIGASAGRVLVGVGGGVESGADDASSDS